MALRTCVGFSAQHIGIDSYRKGTGEIQGADSVPTAHCEPRKQNRREGRLSGVQTFKLGLGTTTQVSILLR